MANKPISKIKEIWKPVSGTKEYYVSNLGKVRKNKIILNQSRHGNGYLSVSIYGKTKLVHRIVADAFLIKNKNYVVNHINGIKDDNNVKNLEWTTHSGNMKHAWKNGLAKPNNLKGSKNHFHKLKEKDVLIIKKMLSNKTNGEIAIIFNVKKACISKIRVGRTWKHVTINGDLEELA